MRGLDRRKDGRTPAGFVESGTEIDVFVIGEKGLVEDGCAERLAAVESSRGGGAPGPPGGAGVPPACRAGLLPIRAVETPAVPGAYLPEGAVADIDSGAVDRGRVP